MNKAIRKAIKPNAEEVVRVVNVDIEKGKRKIMKDISIYQRRKLIKVRQYKLLMNTLKQRQSKVLLDL